MYGTTVGVISLGMIGRAVAERLRQFDLTVIAYDPFIKPADSEALGVKMVSLEDLFAQSDVVELPRACAQGDRGHASPQTFRLHENPTPAFLNTARGIVVNEPEIINVLRERDGSLGAPGRDPSGAAGGRFPSLRIAQCRFFSTAAYCRQPWPECRASGGI